MSIEQQAFGLVGADDELGRTAADVDARRYGPGSVQVRGRADELEPRLLLTREQLGPHTEDLLDRIEEIVAIARVARRARRRRAHALDPELVDDRRGTRAAPRATRSIASGWSDAVAVDTLAQAGDLACAARATTSLASRPGPSTSATSSRVELVPMSIAATRVIAGSPPPNVRPDRRRPRGDTRSARGGTSPRAPLPPTPPLGRGPA